jgi:hypothetical protein
MLQPGGLVVVPPVKRDGWGDEGKDKGQYANGFDEDNATYLNDTWGGIPVRVGSRAGSRTSRQSGVGWE